MRHKIVLMWVAKLLRKVDVVEQYQAAGFFNVTTNYQGEVMKHANATSPRDCYDQCKAFNGECVSHTL